MIRNLFIPTQQNNYTPKLLHRNAMVIYTFILIGFNLLFSPFLGIIEVEAAISIEELVTFHNQERLKAGLSPLTLSTTLSRSASDKANVMLELDCWSHYCPPEVEPWEYFKAVGYNYQHAGENLAEGFSTIESVMSAWMNSPTHKENILNGNFNEIGIGFAYGSYQGRSNNTIITIHFGKKFELSQVVEDVPVTSIETPIDKDTLINTDSFITIDNLQDNQILNNNKIHVQGQLNPPNNTVGIIANSSVIGKVNAEGSYYTYRSEPDYKDGKYNITAQLYDDNGKVLANSEVYQIVLDGEFPLLDQTSINVNQSIGDTVIVDFKATADTVSVSSDTPMSSLQKDDTLSRWYISFAESELTNKDNITITLNDKSGNESQFVLKTDEISAIIATVKSTASGSYTIDKSGEGLFISFINRIASGGIKTIVPIIFTIYLLSLFLLDFIVLSKTDKLHLSPRNSHLKAAIFLILLLIFSFGSLTGSIVTETLVTSSASTIQ